MALNEDLFGMDTLEPADQAMPVETLEYTAEKADVPVAYDLEEENLAISIHDEEIEESKDA